ncbi:XRE family transcriptional regulator [Lacticaseibacillus paracasei]|uniref:XRE family transcriptional regulator n=1 Tax=Lacticaseibacillus paracasei TaxID=1597 RepID=UPI0021C2DC12|nr:XRE family transcriptional regulator [Lacticaseibacillus paracasei]MCP9305290.1 helix-turn-helix transcriptional regulator [Lacticaseibacillus paracasei]
MNVGERMKTIRKQKGISADSLAAKIGVSRSTIFRYEKGDIEKVPIEVVAKVADALDIKPAVLMGLKADTVVDKIHDTVVQLHPARLQKVYTYAEKQLNEQKNPDNVVSLDEARAELNLDEPAYNVEIDGIVAAGYGAFNDDRDEPMDTVKIPDSAIPSHYDYCFKVVGDSMSPYYEDGEFVFVQKTQDVTNGMIAVVDIDNMTFIKKLIFEQGRLCLRSLNDDVDEKTGERIYPDFYADETDIIDVIGKVVGSYAFK